MATSDEPNFGPMEASLQTSGDSRSSKPVFIPQETPDHPFDITLMVKNGRKFKAHRLVLSEASPFFEKLLNSDMKESNEGVIRLETLTELGMRDVLEFIYTGSVQIWAEVNAQELIAVADYLVLPRLKALAESVLVKNLNCSNSISTYYFGERYQCEELSSVCKNFILANFTIVATTEEFFNLSSREVKMWISNDEINVSAEEDVFKIVLMWVSRDRSERKKYFAELFCEVRLVYVTRDYLHRDVVTNDLVNDTEGCIDLVKDAMKFFDFESYVHRSVKPRSCLETPVIVVCLRGVRKDDQILYCYYPHLDTWSRFQGSVPPKIGKLVSCHGKLYFFSRQDNSLLFYDSFSNRWMSLPYEEHRTLRNIFVRNEGEIFALLSVDNDCCHECISLRSQGTNIPCGKMHLSFLTKYKPETNSWEDITSFDLGSRVGICVVAKDNFIYFLGGYSEAQFETLKNADRYDLSTNSWDKVAELQEPRQNASGAATNGKIFIAGGVSSNDISKSYEVYFESTNEWQLFMTRFERTPLDSFSPTLLCVDNTLYLLIRYMIFCSPNLKDEIGCLYELQGNEWREKTQIPNERMLSAVGKLNKFSFITFSCSMKVVKGHNFLQQAAFPNKDGKQKCAIM